MGETLSLPGFASVETTHGPQLAIEGLLLPRFPLGSRGGLLAASSGEGRKVRGRWSASEVLCAQWLAQWLGYGWEPAKGSLPRGLAATTVP